LVLNTRLKRLGPVARPESPLGGQACQRRFLGSLRLPIERRFGVENVRPVVYRSIPRTQGGDAPAVFDGREDRGRVVLGVVDDEVAAQARREDQGGDPGAWAPLVVRSGGAALSWRRDVVPLAAELVIGHHDHGVLAAGAAVDRFQKADQVVAARGLARVAGVLVLEPDRLDEADLVEL